MSESLGRLVSVGVDPGDDEDTRLPQGILSQTGSLAVGDPPGPRFHMGIDSGPALVGDIGSEEYGDLTAIGDTVDLASRLEGRAEPGQAVISALGRRASSRRPSPCGRSVRSRSRAGAARTMPSPWARPA